MHKIYKQQLDTLLLENIRSWASAQPAHRGNGPQGYWHSASGRELPQLDQWWTAPVEVPQQILLSLEGLHTSELEYYSADCVCAEPGMTECRPHVDTPYRFEPWQGAPSGLGAQYIVPLETTTWHNGSTGIMPNSEQYVWPIQSCYEGAYTDLFEANVVQYDLELGDVLQYDPRVLHSTMPNYSQQPRWVLLVSYIHRDIWHQVRELDEAVG